LLGPILRDFTGMTPVSVHRKPLTAVRQEPAADVAMSANDLKAVVNSRLAELAAREGAASPLLADAVAYSLLTPGKRIRPLITLLTAEHFCGEPLRALDAGCAIEMIHAASLCLDDLPMMDNADLRRNQPTTHRKFGEDVAVLASISLLSMAFGTVSGDKGLGADARLHIIDSLSAVVGPQGLASGQLLDLRTQSLSANEGDLVTINAYKTACLFSAAAEAGALAAGAHASSIPYARHFGHELGLAFQIADDVLDAPEFAAVSGKDTGKDATKPTLSKTLGVAGAKALYERHAASCRDHLQKMGAGGSLLHRLVEHSFQALKI
jgi:geranylgeranyl diphosphate synthase, type II